MKRWLTLWPILWASRTSFCKPTALRYPSSVGSLTQLRQAAGLMQRESFSGLPLFQVRWPSPTPRNTPLISDTPCLYQGQGSHVILSLKDGVPFNAGGHSTRQPGFSTTITLFVPWLYSCGNQGCLHGPVASLEAPGPASSLSYCAEDSPGRCLKIQLLSIIP